MNKNKISFIANKGWLKKDDENKPVQIIRTIPDWYRQADRFAKNPLTGDFWIGPDKGKVPTWKACPALFDILGTGYTFVTPCDIEFFINENGKADVKVLDPRYKDFCSTRDPMPQFEHPHGFYQEHFNWFSEWAVKVPEGYSVLYSTPFNRYELPFMTVAGIIDNDKVHLPGSMPFFLRDGWTGIVKAGTPYVQLIPFLRENWESDYVIESHTKIMINNMENSKKYRVPDGGVYKNEVWTKRTYE